MKREELEFRLTDGKRCLLMVDDNGQVTFDANLTLDEAKELLRIAYSRQTSYYIYDIKK